MTHPTTHIVGPAHWAPYLINGDATGLEPHEVAQADAWLAREGVAIVGTEPDAEPWFSWQVRTHAPEMGVNGAMLLDYRAIELTIEES